jgi:hypothetical protein
MLHRMRPELTAIYPAACYTESGVIKAAMAHICANTGSETYVTMMRTWAAATNTEPQFSAVADTDGHCKYCHVKAAGRCPVVAGTGLAELAKQSPALSSVMAGPCDVTTVDGADEFLERLRMVTDYLEPLEKAAKATITAAGGSERYGVINVKGRETLNAKAALAALGDDLAPFVKTGEPTTQIRRKK